MTVDGVECEGTVRLSRDTAILDEGRVIIDLSPPLVELTLRLPPGAASVTPGDRVTVEWGIGPRTVTVTSVEVTHGVQMLRAVAAPSA